MAQRGTANQALKPRNNRPQALLGMMRSRQRRTTTARTMGLAQVVMGQPLLEPETATATRTLLLELLPLVPPLAPPLAPLVPRGRTRVLAPMLLRRIPLVLRVFPTTAPLSRAGQRRRQSTPDFAGRLATQR